MNCISSRQFKLQHLGSNSFRIVALRGKIKGKLRWSSQGAWKQRQRLSSYAHLSCHFQSLNPWPSLSVEVKSGFLLLPEILDFTSQMTHLRTAHKEYLLAGLLWTYLHQFSSPSSFSRLYKNTSNSLVLYCNPLLSSFPKHLEKLQKVQNSAGRLILKARRWDDVSPLLRTLHWLPIQAHTEDKLSILHHSLFSDTAPVYLSDLHVYSPSKTAQLPWLKNPMHFTR